MFHPEIKELIQVTQLVEEGKEKEVFQIISKLEQKSDLSLKEQLSCDLVKAELFRVVGNYLKAIETAEIAFQKAQKLGDLLSSFDALMIQTYSYMIMVNVNKSEALIEQAQDLFNVIKETLKIDLRERECFLVKTKSGITYFKGDVQKTLELNKKAYDLVKNTSNKRFMASSLSNIAQMYSNMKEYDKAILYAKDAIKLNERYTLVHAFSNLIEIYVSKGEINEAKANLELFREYIKKFDTERHRVIYTFTEALVLKSSLRARDRIKSEDLFKSIALNNSINSEQRIDAIINLCDLCLIELKITNDFEITTEIQGYIQELLDIANHQNAHLILIETYILKGKLLLLTSNIKEAKRLLNQAQDIAETYGLKQLAINISNEHDKLLKQEKIWRRFKDSEVNFSERLELAGLNEEIDDMMKKRIIEPPELIEEEPIYLLLISEGGLPIFTQSFIEDTSFEDHLFGGFFTAINSFINEMFSEGLDRASFGNHTLLMKSIFPFLLFYLYRGQSYLAQKRINSFIKELKDHTEIWKKFEEFYEKSRKISLKDIPSLAPLIKKTFIQKTLY